MTDSGKLPQTFTIRVQINISLNHDDIHGWLALNYPPWFYNHDVYKSWR